MSRAGLVARLGLSLAAVAGVGCSHLRPAPAATAATAAPATTVAASPVPAAPVATPAEARPAAAPPVQAVAAVPVQAPKASGASPAASPAAKAPATAVAPKVAVVKPAARPEATAPRAPAAPTLDLAALEQRLRDTHSIGLFTKLSLKNQVDDLLDQARAYYRAQGKPPPTALRQRYEGLLMRVITLLQEGDAPLAAAIATSREAIWGILADPDKLSQI
jgi:hypothetical protein